MLLVAFAVSNVAVAQQTTNGVSLGKFDATTFSLKMPETGNVWRSSLKESPFTFASKSAFSQLKAQNPKQKTVTSGDSQIGPVNSFGTIYSPDGTELIYTAKYDFDSRGMYTAAHLTFYNKKNEVIATIDDSFELSGNQTGINSVTVDPNITKKFFNVDDKYEVIIMIHATTSDYQGYIYQHVFSLEKGQTTPLMTIPGREILIEEMATDQWSEKKQMVMMREEITADDDYLMHFDVYEHAGWNSLYAPQLLHTFTFKYEEISGSGESSCPIAVQNVGGKAHYALAHYEKPFFDPDIPYTEEPVVTPDNTFIIDLYTQDDFEKPYKTINIPMETDEGYLFTFPCLGAFLGNEDFSFGLFGSATEPYFIVSHDNYVTSSDDFVTSVFLYDQNGNLVKTIATGASDYMQMSDIQGEEALFCLVDNEEEMLKFMKFPSCEMTAEIPFIYEDRLLSVTLDRVPATDQTGGAYNIVISGSQGEMDSNSNVLHPIAYFNADGSLNHWDFVNLGAEVNMAQPAISKDWLNPYLFDTDKDADYMFLVKVPVSGVIGSSLSEEHLWILNKSGEKHADFGPDDSKGVLNAISILNSSSSEPVLSAAYYDWENSSYTLDLTNLPLSRFTEGGDGTPSNPYVISSLGDLMQIVKAPAANYILTKDIDCNYYPFTGNDCEFSGTIDGQGHTINNLCITGSALISNMIGKAEVKNLNIEKPIIYPNSGLSGILAATVCYDGTYAPNITNVHILSPIVDDDEYDGVFGTIVGQLTTGATLTACSVTDAEINMPQATVGGIVGNIATSGANVNAVYFEGNINGGVVGGIVGDASAASLKNAHVKANIVGTMATGGVIGKVGEYKNNRGSFANCYVEGTITSVNETDAAVGGIAGAVDAGENLCLTNNIVQLEAINSQLSTPNSQASAHRIAGHTCADELGEVLWEDPWWDEFEDDPYEHKDLWPRAAVAPDAGFANNYAISPVEPINGDEQMAKDATSVEGRTAEASEGQSWQTLFTERGFLFGEEASSPWIWNEDKPALWFESGITPSAIEAVRKHCITPLLALSNGTLQANGTITVYTAAGVKVATAAQSLNIKQLKPGMYVATSAGKSVKFTVK